MLVISALASPAAAHGELGATDPAPDETVRRAPRSVSITFTEPPTAQAVLTVRDGCNRDVGQGVEVAEATATVRVATGQPGRWRVSYRVISALDGHQTRGGYAFTVAGEKDCTPDATPAPDGTEPDDGATQAAPTDDGDGEPGSGAPVIPIALGAVAVVVLAAIVRRYGSA
ncbi:MAG: copper resistance protein CopC [Actinomycetota bacterium]|nr:copper resistance protein CopC [Actinomycetota bacterium]